MQLVPDRIFDGAEGLAVTVSPQGDAVFHAERPAHLLPERALALAFALLVLYAPTLMAAIEREVRAQRLRVVQGGGEGDAA